MFRSHSISTLDQFRLTDAVQSLQALLDTLCSALTPSASPSPSPSTTLSDSSLGTTTPWVAWAPFGAALVAATAAIAGAVLQRRSGREAAQAAARSAKAAEDAVAHSALSSEAAGYRIDQEALHRRYQDASAQLGSPGAAVRMAGVFAMARLADDWEHQRQTCVSVLCGYLRMPWGQVEGSSVAEESEIRRTVLALIGEHTQPAAEPSWSDLVFDLRGARLPKFYWSESIFRKRPLFQGAHFGDGAVLTSCTFAQGVTFAQCTITASLWLRGIVVRTGHLQLAQALVTKEGRLTLDLAYLGEQASASLMGLERAGNLFVLVRATEQPQGMVYVNGMTLGRQSRVSIELDKPASPQLVTSGYVPQFRFGRWSVSKSAHFSVHDKLGAVSDLVHVED